MTTVPAALHVPELADETGFVHGFSTVLLGSVGLTHAPDPEAVFASRLKFLNVLGLDGMSLTVAGAVHGADVACVEEPLGIVADVDALVTDRPGVPLFATYADCYPILLWDPDEGVAGLAHAGWRGTQAGVGAATIAVMREQFGCRHIKAAIGPGICGRCYEVGPEFAERFDARYLARGEGDRLLLDLAAVNRDQLAGAGAEAVYDIGICTKESYLFPSHRRHPDGKRFGAIVAIR